MDSGFLQHWVATYGYVAVFVGTFLEGETTMVIGGFLAHRGYLDFWGVVAAGWLGTISADQLWFHAGQRYGRAWVKRRPAWRASVTRAEQLLERHHLPVILGSRFVYGVRTVIPFAVGVASIGALRFLLLDVLAVSVWAFIVAGLGSGIGALLQITIGRLAPYEPLMVLVIALAGLAVWMLRRGRRHRRQRLYSTPLPEEWRTIIRNNLPLYALLPEEDRRELEGHVRVLMAEKHFEGCGGLELTDEIRVTIAAHAALLLLHRDTDYYPGVVSILVYPDTYVAPRTDVGEGGHVTQRQEARLGESHLRDSVVLSWNAVRTGAANPHDGHDVVLHEFAHQLDTADGLADGTPRLAGRSAYAVWSRVLGTEYDELRKRVDHHRRSDLDAYGATNPAEFFAVVTEAFFEKPLQMKKRHPRLYEQLRSFYRQDPAALLGNDAKTRR